ncbi:hypothetical protein HPB48_021834 [Haemaphysalis longicornis]|uniref:Uncharacterized protein n=1 Tax=Haemaphysalis longicornis TaxID=44386 RepID=A0A9J6FV01_HAELO|nr:hypothetical protein HPB48_021834 [Haemaphysalis longicornis]
MPELHGYRTQIRSMPQERHYCHLSQTAEAFLQPTRGWRWPTLVRRAATTAKVNILLQAPTARRELPRTTMQEDWQTYVESILSLLIMPAKEKINQPGLMNFWETGSSVPRTLREEALVCRAGTQRSTNKNLACHDVSNCSSHREV